MKKVLLMIENFSSIKIEKSCETKKITAKEIIHLDEKNNIAHS
jgi:hypothetical protein